MKIAKLKLANAIKCGTKTLDFLASEHYDMTLSDGILIRVASKARDGIVCYTTLMNTVWWWPLEEKATAAPARGRTPQQAKVEPVL